MMNSKARLERRQLFMTPALYKGSLDYQRREVEATLAARDADHQKTPNTLHDFTMHEMAFVETLDYWRLRYTGGAPIASLAREFRSVVDAFEAWQAMSPGYRDALNRKYPDDGAAIPPDFPACNLDQMDNYYQFISALSISILIRDVRSVKRLLRCIRAGHADSLLERLGESYGMSITGTSSTLHPRPWERLNKAYYVDTDEESLASVKDFLRHWYPAMRPLYFHGRHEQTVERIVEGETVASSRYFGYWAFEAGAVVYLLDLDDSRIDAMAYPRDLVDYGRGLWARGEFTSPDEPLAEEGGDESQRHEGHASPARAATSRPAP